MSDIMTKDDRDTIIDEDDVIAFLRKHPRFLINNPEICDLLEPPAQHDGRKSGVADFQHYMVKRLKEDRDGIIEEAREIVEISRANASNLSRIQRSVLMLLDAYSFEDFIHALTMDCATVLDVDIISLIVETDGGTVPHINLTGVHAVTPGTVALVMRDRGAMLEGNIIGLDEVYGGGAGLVKSQALVKLIISQHLPPAMIAFGSRDPVLFQEGQGTEQIAFLGRVIESCFRSWLNLPAQ
jgi:uncharacterized protein YigA (DUF484 family)